MLTVKEKHRREENGRFGPRMLLKIAREEKYSD